MVKINPRQEHIPQAIIQAYWGVAASTIGHTKGLKIMDSAIKPVYKRCKVVGPAVTVRAPGDTEVLNHLTGLVRPGDVLVIDRGGDSQNALIGEFRALQLVYAGFAGCVVDGAVCDILAIEDMGFPLFSRSISAAVYKAAGMDGAINVPVSCGGVTVNPGDLIIADDDGVVVLSPEEAEMLLPRLLAKEAAEVEKRKQFAHILYRNRKA